MKIVAFFLLLLVAFAAAQTDIMSFTFTGDSTTPGDVIELYQEGQVNNNDNSFQFTESANQSVTVTVSAGGPTPVYVCLSEYVVISSNMSSCPPEGFIDIDASDMTEVDFYGQDGTGGAKKQLLLRALMADGSGSLYSRTVQLTGLRIDTLYHVSAMELNDANASNETVSVEITWNSCSKPHSYGPQCSVVPNTTLATGTPFTGSIVQGSPLFVVYDLEQNFTSSLTFNLNFTSEQMFALNLDASDSTNSNITVFIRRNAFPAILNGTTATAVSAPDPFTAGGENGTYFYTVPNPEPGLWFFFAVSSSDVSLPISVSSVISNCPAGTYPASNGCVGATIITGSMTNQTNTSFPANGTAFTYSPNATETVTFFTWTTQTLTVGVGNVDTADNAPYLYASYVGVPSSESSIVSSTEDTLVNFVNAANNQVQNWVIAVEYSTPSTDSFLIWATTNQNFPCANNCSGHGTDDICDPTTAICVCASGYKGFDCSGQSLKVVYIVLIAIGGAIVLAIAIGVPIGCYIKNRKRARYERV